ncbi:uncharacterized protein [Watersipora subatra]|uniref:uncharacterized protein n=1 Tax=Watersipora subatra TaxID=2589382 RepID=UPI00355C40AC
MHLAEPSQARAKPSRAKLEPSQAKAEPSRVESSRVEPNRAQPTEKMRVYLLAAVTILLTSSGALGLDDVEFGLGTEQPTNYYRALGDDDNIEKVTLSCATNKAIHISYFKVHRCLRTLAAANSTFEQDCEWIDISTGTCEGISGRCLFSIYSLLLYDRDIQNRVNLTFQCIPNAQIYEMDSPISSTLSSSAVPVYLATPSFRSYGGTYPNYAHYSCIVESDIPVQLMIAFLYLELESYSSFGITNCYDYLSIGTSGNNKTEYCKDSTATLPTWQQNGVTSVEIIFRSDSSYSKRGAWFAVYPDSPSDTVQISCQNDYTTRKFQFPTTFYWDRTTTDKLDDYDDYDDTMSSLQIAQIVGGALSAAAFLCAFISAVVCLYLR